MKSSVIATLEVAGASVALAFVPDPEAPAMARALGYAISHVGTDPPDPIRRHFAALTRSLASLGDAATPESDALPRIARACRSAIPGARLVVRRRFPADQRAPRWPATMRSGAPSAAGRDVWPFDAELAGLLIGRRKLLLRESLTLAAAESDAAWLASHGVATRIVGGANAHRSAAGVRAISATITPVRDVERAASSAPLHDVEHAAASAPVHDVEHATASAPVHDVERAAASAPAPDVERAAMSAKSLGSQRIYASLDPAILADAAAIHEDACRVHDGWAEAARWMGDALGYPACCVRTFASARKRDDVTMFLDLLPPLPHRPAAPFTLWLDGALALISHAPCSLECEATLDLATSVLAELDRGSPGFSARWRALARRVHALTAEGRMFALAAEGDLLATGTLHIVDAVEIAPPASGDTSPLVTPVAPLQGATLHLDRGYLVAPSVPGWTAALVADHRGIDS